MCKTSDKLDFQADLADEPLKHSFPTGLCHELLDCRHRLRRGAYTVFLATVSRAMVVRLLSRVSRSDLGGRWTVFMRIEKQICIASPFDLTRQCLCAIRFSSCKELRLAVREIRRCFCG